MKSNAYLNGQDILNWYKTPFEMEFTNKGFPILEPLKSLPIPRQGLRTLPFNYALSNNDRWKKNNDKKFAAWFGDR